MIPVQLIAAAIAGLSFAGAWSIQTNRYERVLSDQRNEYLKRDFKALEVAHAQTISLQEKKNDAERKAQVRIASLRHDAAATSTALVRLSASTESALRHASDSHSACIADANNLAIVFGKCTVELQSVAADADLLSSNVQTLVEAWPQ